MADYSNYSDIYNIYHNLSYIRHFFNCVFSANEFTRLSAYPYEQIKQLDFETAELAQADQVLGRPHQYYKEIKDKVEVLSKGMDIVFALPCTPTDQEGYDKCLKIVKSVFPDFKPSLNWKIETAPSKRVVPVISSPIKRSISLLELERLRISYTPRSDASYADQLYLATELDDDKNHYKENIRVELTIKQGYSNVDPMYVSVDSGSFEGMRGSVFYQVNVDFFVNFPKEFAKWATYAKGKDEVSPTNFLHLINQNAQYAFVDGAEVPTTRIKPISEIKRENEEKVRQGVRKVRPRVNQDGFAMLRTGRIIWVPDSDNVTNYYSILKRSFDPKTGYAAPYTELGVTDKPLYADWLNNVLVYINTAGNMEYQSLVGCLPLSSQTIARVLHSPVTYIGEEFFDVLNKFHPGNISFTVNGFSRNYNLKQCYEILKENDVTWEQVGARVKDSQLKLAAPHSQGTDVDLYNTPHDDKTQDDEEKKKPHKFQGMFDALHPIFDKAFTDFSNVPCSLTTKIRNFRFCLVLVTSYSKMAKQFYDSYELNLKYNASRSLAGNEPKTVYNLPGLSSYMPHQVQALQNMETSSGCALIDISAGGGKALISLTALLDLIQKGTTKRALVIMPDRLIKNYIDEVNAFSRGKVNTFAFKTSVFDRLGDMGYDDKKMLSVVRSMPKNTVFIAGYNFIKSKRGIDGMSKGDLIYGTYKMPVYPNANFLIECEFDTIVLDESHYMKNSSSQATQATAMVVANAERKYLMSGTLVSDTITDYVGQMAFIDPTILGSRESFKENYLGEASRGQVTTAGMTGIVNHVQNSILPYVKKITCKRREWAPFLPKMIEFSHPVRLNVEQQDFYEDLMTKALDDIKKDPKYAKILKQGRPEDEQKIEAALKRYLAGVEVFVNAPESNAAFTAQNRDNPAAWISPKVEKVNQILDAHFHGGEVDGFAIKQSTGKVLIFCYNKAVTPHIFQYINYKNQAIMIRTGDEDALVRFKEDPNLKIAVADESGLREGFSLTECTAIIRIQTTWTPGGQEQSISRMLRPDPSDKYGRTSCRYHVIYTEYTLECSKVARMFSKVINKARSDEYGQPGWSDIEKTLDELPVISMNLDFIHQFKTDSDLEDYWNAYAKFRNWEFSQFDMVLNRYKQKYVAKHGKEPSRLELMKDIMVPVEHQEIADSKRAWCPFVEGMVVPVDPYGLDLQPVILAENNDSDEDEDGDGQETKVERGDHVWTEFGPGQVVNNPRAKTLKVSVTGIGEVSLPKSSVFVAGDFGSVGAKKQAKLTKLFQMNKGGSLTLKPGTTNSKYDVAIVNGPVIEDKTPKTVEETVDDTEDYGLKRGGDNQFNISVANINNQIALFTTANKDATKIVGNGWKYNAPFYYTMVKTKKGFANLMDGFNNKKVKISPLYKKRLLEVEPMIVAGGKKFLQNKPLKLGEIKNFFRVSPTPLKDGIRPYPLFYDNVLHVAVNAKTHSRYASKIRSNVVSGCTPWKLNPAILIKFYATRQAALTDLVSLNKKEPIDNYKQVVNELKTMVFKKQAKKK